MTLVIFPAKKRTKQKKKTKKESKAMLIMPAVLLL